MYLEKLTINGFKSFAQKSLLEFKPGIAAIVGPNGSGKSNVSDAMRWVLGEQSLKMLRGKKGEDVIFSGSDKRARLGLAEVSLQFNNHQDQHGLGMSEIIITRRLYRNGDSEYLINNQKSRLLDIQMLLAKAGVAHTSYSIIGQGQIDAFLLASKEDRQEFFEEASGVKSLQIKRSQTLNKLEATEANLETVTIQLNEIEPRLNSLTRQVKKLEQRFDIETKLSQFQEKYYGAMWFALHNDWQKMHSELKEAAQEEEKSRQLVNQLQNELEQVAKGQSKNTLLEQLQKDYQNLVEEKIKVSQELTELKIKAASEISLSQTKVKRNDLPEVKVLELQSLLEELQELVVKIKKSILDNNSQSFEKIIIEEEKLLGKIEAILLPYKKSTSDNNQNKSIVSASNQATIDKILGNLQVIDEKIKSTQQAMQDQAAKEKEARAQIWDYQQKYQAGQQNLSYLAQKTNNLRVEIARLETHKDDLEAEIKQEMSASWLEEQNKASVATTAIDNDEKRNLSLEISRLKHQLELIGGIDPEVQQEYTTTKERFEFLDSQTNDLKNSLASLEKLIIELDETIKKQFEISFKIINEEFQKYFKVLFDGGQAKLILIKKDESQDIDKNETLNNEEILAGEEVAKEKAAVQKIKDRLNNNVYAGVEIEATPPGKKLKSISMLSGGERAMTSIALLCAIISANPSPFVVLDEVDAALDEANSVRYAEILERLSGQSQFVIITHNRATMEKADILYGVTMGSDGASTLLSLKLESAEQYTNR